MYRFSFCSGRRSISGSLITYLKWSCCRFFCADCKKKRIATCNCKLRVVFFEPGQLIGDFARISTLIAVFEPGQQKRYSTFRQRLMNELVIRHFIAVLPHADGYRFADNSVSLSDSATCNLRKSIKIYVLGLIRR